MKSHLKRLKAPRSWSIPKKENKYVGRPKTSKPYKLSISLTVLFRDLLKVASTRKEVKQLLKNDYIFINGKRQVDPKDTLAIMDCLEIKSTDEAYRLFLDKRGKLCVGEVKKKEKNLVPLRLMDKTLLKGGKIQLNFYNGYNLIVEKDEGYKSGDVLLFDFQKKA